jgi:tetratricopeptide (TPR) repeat protein
LQLSLILNKGEEMKNGERKGKITTRPLTEAEAYYKIALKFLDKNKCHFAIAAFSEVIALQPQHYKAFYHRGIAKIQQTKYNEAILDFTEATNLQPGNSQAYNGAALAYFQLNDFENCIAYCKKAIDLQPNNNPMAYYRLGLAYMKSNQYGFALPNFAKAKKQKCIAGEEQINEYIKLCEMNLIPSTNIAATTDGNNLSSSTHSATQTQSDKPQTQDFEKISLNILPPTATSNFAASTSSSSLSNSSSGSETPPSVTIHLPAPTFE